MPCPPLTPPLDGDITSGNHTYTFGEHAVFSCIRGYQLTSSVTVHCLATGQWNSSEPECNIVLCPALSSPAYGELNGTLFTYESIAQFSCNDGYNLNGSSTLECQDTGDWSDLSPLCLPVDCGPLQHPPNGRVHVNSSTKFMSNATFSCLPGYDLQGNAIATCQADGQWSSSTPACRPVDCSHPGTPQDGTVDGVAFTFSNIVTFRCNSGYSLSGALYLRCDESGRWNGSVPVCNPVNCSSLSAPTRGKVSSPQTSYGSIATFNCDTGYRVQGSSALTCTANATWNGSEPTCQIVTCPSLNIPVNVIAIPQSLNTTYLVSNSFSCSSGYELQGPSMLTCTQNGTWSSPKTPTCEPISCRSLRALMNGMLASSNGFFFRSVVRFTCLDGYTISNTNPLQCLANKQWNGSEPTCHAVMCPPLPDPANGFIEGPNFAHFMFAIVVRCNEGFAAVGDTRLECTSNATWSNDLPSCDPIVCPDLPNITAGSILPRNTDLGYGVNVTLICSEGFTAVGETVAFCLEQGNWIPDVSQTFCQAGGLRTVQQIKVAHSVD